MACDTAVMASDHPHEAIIKVAEERGCDLIAMASHGRKGISGLLLGSETQKVLTHSKKPVLVFRQRWVRIKRPRPPFEAAKSASLARRFAGLHRCFLPQQQDLTPRFCAPPCG